MKVIGILICIVLFYSCSKESYEKRDVRAGQKVNMNIKSYDETLGFDQSSHYFDLNNDKKNDFLILTETWGSPGLGHHPRLSIVALHQDAELAGYFTIDTTVVFKGSVIYYKENGIDFVTTDYYTCICNYSNYDSIAFISPCFKLNYYFDDDMITGSEEYISDTVLIGDDYLDYGGWQTGISGDTTFIHKTIFYNDCYVFPQGVVVYIGVRINKKRLGWIKLIISDLDRVSVLETALQRL